MVPGSAAPQVGRIHGLLDPHASCVARLFFLAHVKTEHVFSILVFATFFVGATRALFGAILHQIFVTATAP